MSKRIQGEDDIDYEPQLRIPKNEMVQKLFKQIEAIKGLMRTTRDSMEFDSWRRETELLLIHAFGSRSRQVQEFREVRYSPMIYTSGTDTTPSYIRGLEKALNCLSVILKDVNEYYDDIGEVRVKNSVAEPVGKDSTDKRGVNSRKIFVVHGHDEGMKASVEEFLKKLDLEPIILHKQPNEGKTIIEKFEANADVAFAVILMSPDDEGYERDAKETLACRARQNVILELGYFIGRLGRKCVCALKAGEIELPSDVLGVLYIPYDSHGGWKNQLIKEICAAGIQVEDTKIVSALIP